MRTVESFSDFGSNGYDIYELTCKLEVYFKYIFEKVHNDKKKSFWIYDDSLYKDHKEEYINFILGRNGNEIRSILIKMIYDLIKYKSNISYFYQNFAYLKYVIFPEIKYIFKHLEIEFEINELGRKIHTEFGNIYAFDTNKKTFMGGEFFRSYIDGNILDTSYIGDIGSLLNLIQSRNRISVKNYEFSNLNKQYLCITPVQMHRVLNIIKDNDILKKGSIRFDIHDKEYIEGVALELRNKIRKS